MSIHLHVCIVFYVLVIFTGKALTEDVNHKIANKHIKLRAEVNTEHVVNHVCGLLRPTCRGRQLSRCIRWTTEVTTQVSVLVSVQGLRRTVVGIVPTEALSAPGRKGF